MLPLQLTGIALAGRMLVSKYNGDSLAGKNKGKMRFKQPPGEKSIRRKPTTTANPIQGMFKGLTSALSRIAEKPAREDYSAVIKGFLPGGAELLRPKYPANAGEYQLADLDGDGRSELITSFRLNNEVKTVILKGQGGQWNKAAEISHPGHDTLHFRGFADITGEAGKQLMAGLGSQREVPTLYGYSLAGSSPKKLFTHDYHRFEVLEAQENKRGTGRVQLAVWNREDPGVDKIQVLGWNGLQLESVKDAGDYYYRRVVPYYARKIKKTPYEPSHWYNLANALVEAGARRDALIAVEVGAGQAPDSIFKDRFSALREKILDK